MTNKLPARKELEENMELLQLQQRRALTTYKFTRVSSKAKKLSLRHVYLQNLVWPLKKSDESKPTVAKESFVVVCRCFYDNFWCFSVFSFQNGKHDSLPIISWDGNRPRV